MAPITELLRDWPQAAGETVSKVTGDVGLVGVGGVSRKAAASILQGNQRRLDVR